VKLADQWRDIEDALPDNWRDARLVLTVPDDARCDRAAALLGPAAPLRSGRTIRFFTGRRGAGIGPDAITRLLRRLDREGIEGMLELAGSEDAPAEPHISRATLAASWDAALAVLPSDWSDLYVEVELRSGGQFDRAALLAAPLNPLRTAHAPGFRFRCARNFGYGASPAMTRRCLARLDEETIEGRLRILHALSDTHPVGTQGPVWHVAGRTV
jgi:hypothetical protein